jgi:hypothetical protein
VQDCWNLLLGASRRRVKQVHGERDQGCDRLLDDAHQDIAVLAESSPPNGESASCGEKIRRRQDRQGKGSAPERADHLEHDHGARADLMDVVASEESLGALKQLRPPLREVIRDERLERARELDSDHTRRGPGKEREDVALQSRAVSRRDRPVIGPYARRLYAVGRCDAIFDPDGNSLAGSAAQLKGKKRKGAAVAIE